MEPPSLTLFKNAAQIKRHNKRITVAVNPKGTYVEITSLTEKPKPAIIHEFQRGANTNGIALKTETLKDILACIATLQEKDLLDLDSITYTHE